MKKSRTEKRKKEGKRNRVWVIYPFGSLVLFVFVVEQGGKRKERSEQ